MPRHTLSFSALQDWIEEGTRLGELQGAPLFDPLPEAAASTKELIVLMGKYEKQTFIHGGFEGKIVGQIYGTTNRWRLQRERHL